VPGEGTYRRWPGGDAKIGAWRRLQALLSSAPLGPRLMPQAHRGGMPCQKNDNLVILRETEEKASFVSVSSWSLQACAPWELQESRCETPGNARPSGRRLLPPQVRQHLSGRERCF